MFRVSCFGFFPEPCFGVIVYGDPGRLTTAPTGALDGSGWQYEGQWGSFTGTPIAPNYFITASHVGGNVGQSFQFEGQSYTTTAYYDDPNSDLRIWKVDETFPIYAPMATKHDAGKKAVIFGRGTDRGDPVTVKNKLRGWQWGATDSSLSWGINKVTVARHVAGNNLLQLKFNGNKRNPDEGAISEGDSGGGVFVKIHKVWTLVGVNYSATDPYSFDSNYADAFSASLTNASHLFTFTSTDQAIWIRSHQPSIGYATRVSSEMQWINSVLNGSGALDVSQSVYTGDVPEPAAAVLALGILGFAFPRRKRRV
ncbi:MAG TPA: hypothetical protein VG722_05015 [Tepidisphaeraceae bacterium]|nr:hypothetical protein [Tepidisphaeraceae bacterium]